MQGLQKFLVALLGMGILAAACAPVAHAASYTDNGKIASQIEAKIDEFSRANIVNYLGFSIYQEGFRKNGDSSESVSTSPDEDMVNKHLAVHCSPALKSENNQFQKCNPPQDGSLTADDKSMLVMGDVNFGVLTGTYEFTAARDLAAQNIIRNITNPFPVVKWQKALTSETPMNGTQRKDYAKYLAGQAVLSVAMNSFESMYAMRVPGAVMGTSGNESKDVSLMSMMADESSRRFEGSDGGDFAALLASDPADPKTQTKLLKELAAMEAFKLWMDWKRFEQMERIEASLAASLAKYVNSSYAADAVMSSVPKK